MKYMVIEYIKTGKLDAVYDRFGSCGRMLPEGLEYIDSWLSEDGDRCFQLMKTEDANLFDVWRKNWDDLVDFEIVLLGSKPM